MEGDLLEVPAIKSLDRLREFLFAVDLVISTVADDNVESMINQIALVDEKPVIYARAIKKATMGRIFLVNLVAMPAKPVSAYMPRKVGLEQKFHLTGLMCRNPNPILFSTSAEGRSSQVVVSTCLSSPPWLPEYL